MARRALEIGGAVAAWHARGGSSVFATFTLRHRKGQSLSDLWAGLMKAWERLQSGPAWLRRKDRHGVHGTIRVTEVNWSWDNGWHVHLHVILLVAGTTTDTEVEDFGGWLSARWIAAVTARGLAAPTGQGQHARLVRDVSDGDLAAYVTKGTDRDLGLEMTQSQSKRARGVHKTEPAWTLLDLIAQGDADALDLWHEYERASKGRTQVGWSRGLRRDLLGQARDVTDDEIAAEAVGDDTVLWILNEGWRTLVGAPHLIPKVLDAAEYSTALLRDLLDAHGVPYLLPKGSL